MITTSTQWAFAVCLLVGCGRAEDTLPPPLDEAERVVHNAPFPGAKCPLGGSSAQWDEVIVDVPPIWEDNDVIVGDFLYLSPALSIDDCGNATMVWDARSGLGLVRLLSDGQLDWARMHQEVSPESLFDRPTGIVTDEYGSIYVASGNSIVSLAAGGRRHPQQPGELHYGVKFIERKAEGFFVGFHEQWTPDFHEDSPLGSVLRVTSEMMT